MYCAVLSTSLEKEMTTHSTTLALNIPWMEQPGRLQSMESERDRQDKSFPDLFSHKLGTP